MNSHNICFRGEIKKNNVFLIPPVIWNLVFASLCKWMGRLVAGFLLFCFCFVFLFCFLFFCCCTRFFFFFFFFGGGGGGERRGGGVGFALRKHAYSKILKILLPKIENFQIKIFWYFSSFDEAVLTSTHNLCFLAEIRKMYTPVNPSFTI